MSRLRAFRRGDGGQTTVEFALAVVLLLVIVLGLFDLGRAVWYSNALAMATREGARYAIVHGSLGAPIATESSIASVVSTYLTGVSGTAETKVTWCDATTSTLPCPSPNPSPIPNASGNFVTVTSMLNYTPLASEYFIGGGLKVTLRRTTTMIIRQ